MNRFLVATACLILPLLASGEVLDKSSHFNVEQDADTGIWTLDCESEVSGIDSSLTHNVGLDLYAGVQGVGIIRLVKRQLDILPDQRRYRESVEGVFDLEIKKPGNRLVVSIQGSVLLARTGDDFTCVININKGPTPTVKGDGLSAIVVRHRIVTSGEPMPEP